MRTSGSATAPSAPSDPAADRLSQDRASWSFGPPVSPMLLLLLLLRGQCGYVVL